MRGHYANIAERAVGLTATVRVRGPDPRGDVAADLENLARNYRLHGSPAMAVPLVMSRQV